MKVVIEKSKISGTVEAPPSKSQAIRLIFYSLLSTVRLESIPESDDVRDALEAVRVLGVKRETHSDGEVLMPPDELRLKANYIKFKGSATTLRFFIPIAASVGGEITIDAEPPLLFRPIKRIVDAIDGRGVSFSSRSLPVQMRGKIKDDVIEVQGDESSQYISGLIYGMLIRGGGRISVVPPISSLSYIRMTISLLNSLGGDVKMHENVITVNGDKKEMLQFHGKVPGDYALSSFFGAASAISGGNLKIINLEKPEDYFGDHSILRLFREMGVGSEWRDNSWLIWPGEIRGIKVNVNEAPDLAVSISTLASASESPTYIQGVERLKIKESDRIKTIIETIKAFGGNAEYEGGELKIKGGKLRRGSITCPADHRIAMMATALSTVEGGEIGNACCVNKSNPKFWAQFSSIGGKVVKYET